MGRTPAGYMSAPMQIQYFPCARAAGSRELQGVEAVHRRHGQGRRCERHLCQAFRRQGRFVRGDASARGQRWEIDGHFDDCFS